MNMQSFEEKLKQISKPEISQLKHQDMLANEIIKAKDKSVLSWWWLSIPLYIIAAFLMKTFYMPHTTLISNIHDFTNKEKFLALLLFLIMPIIFIILNLLSIRKIHFLSGSPKTIIFLKAVWFNIIIIISSILILIIYSL
jgi:hypothetical protein